MPPKKTRYTDGTSQQSSVTAMYATSVLTHLAARETGTGAALASEGPAVIAALKILATGAAPWEAIEEQTIKRLLEIGFGSDELKGASGAPSVPDEQRQAAPEGAPPADASLTRTLLDAVVTMNEALDDALQAFGHQHGRPLCESERSDASEIVYTVGRALLAGEPDILELTADAIRNSRVREWTAEVKRSLSDERPSGSAALALVINLTSISPAAKKLRSEDVLQAWNGRDTDEQVAAQLAFNCGAFGCRTYKEAYDRIRKTPSVAELRERRK